MQWFSALCHAGPSSLVFVWSEGCWILSDGDLQTVLLGGLKRQMSNAWIDRSHSLIFQHKRRPRVIEFTYASSDCSEVHFRSNESQTSYRSIMTADDSIKCRCANSGITGQLGGFQNPAVCLQAFPSFLSQLLLALLLTPFSRGLWLSFLVLCS